jgi:hypothetical protein
MEVCREEFIDTDSQSGMADRSSPTVTGLWVGFAIVTALLIVAVTFLVLEAITLNNYRNDFLISVNNPKACSLHPERCGFVLR